MNTQKRALLFLLLLPLCLSVIFLFIAEQTLARNSRERRVLPLVTAASREFDVPVAMILAVMRTESDFRADAVSEAGAVGLMQLMPSTFDFLREELLQESLSPDRITDPDVNIRYGSYYLSYLYQRFPSWPLALAAYNAGEGRVEEWLSDERLAKDGVLHTIPYPETDAYVRAVLTHYEYYLKKYPIEGVKYD